MSTNLLPTYTTDNCTPAYQLNWAVSLFGNQPLPTAVDWVEPVKPLLEKDNLRILEYRRRSDKVLALLVSTKPCVNPAGLLQVLKGRLQYAVRSEQPRLFRRNYRIESVGSAKREVIERYVARQSQRHPMADPRIQERFAEVQISQPEVDLSRVRYTAHGQFVYNLQLVIEHRDSCGNCSNGFLHRTADTVQRVSRKKALLLKGAGIVANHLHLAIGCGIRQSAEELAFCFLNNLAWAHGMHPIYSYSYYAGTFGNYDLGALWNAQLIENS